MNLTSIAKEWSEMRIAEIQLNESRVKLGKRIMKEMKKRKTSAIEVSETLSVLMDKSTKKNFTKESLLKYLGEDETKKLWTAHPDSVSEYLTLKDRRK